MIAFLAQAAGDEGAAAEEAANETASALDPQVALGLVETYGIPAITVILILLIAYLVTGWASRATSAAMRRGKVDETLALFFGRLVKWLILLLAIIMCLGKFGIQTASLAAVLAAAGFAIGLAFQGTLSNFSAGVMLLVFRPFKVGDVVNVNGVIGKVTEIELFTTDLDTPDNRRIIMPNGAIFGATIENISHHARRRVDVNVGVEYSADIARTRQVLLEAAKGVQDVLDDPAPAAVLSELGDSSVNWVIRVWADAANFWPVKERLTEAAKNALDAAGIGIPFPQMDVYVKEHKQG